MAQTEILGVAIEAVRTGGEVARALVGNPGYLRWKGLGDLTVGSALDVQRAILNVLQGRFPDHTVVAEEMDSRPNVGPGPTWVLDPIDGSINFSRGIPVFSISLAYWEDGLYRAGVVYDPLRDELFDAALRKGARLNGEPIFVSQFSEGIDAFQSAVVGTDWPYSLGRRQESFLVAKMIGSETVGLTVLGSPALGICYVACGRLHGYYHLELQLWDVAAAAVILEEAGGIFTAATGGSWLFSEGGYVASNGVIHGWLSRPIHGVMRFRARDPMGPPGIELEEDDEEHAGHAH